jgi:triphosphoribosyl-dephospho-CoA synthase
MLAPAIARPRQVDADGIADLAVECLELEIDTYPKPGLVSPIDSGAHADMDAALLRASAGTLRPWFALLARAGARDADMATLREIGIAAEADMLATTRGVNTHRGAIFGLGLLAAAAGRRIAHGGSKPLGAMVRQRWGPDMDAAISPPSHGTEVARRYGVGGARAEAMAGFPSVYGIGLPALRACGDRGEAARVQACMCLIAAVDDTNLLYRGGLDGLRFARRAAAGFLARGGIAGAGWHGRAVAIHHQFTQRRISPGGCADLLAMSLFCDRLDP